MTVCLIIPPSPFLLDERVFMSLGVLRIAAVLEHADIPVDVLDLSGIENPEEALRAYVHTHATQVFGVTATTPQMPEAAKLARLLKQIRPEAQTILGGPHPTLVVAAARKKLPHSRADRALWALYGLFDVIVAGDGERAIFEAIKPWPDRYKLMDADDPKSDLFLTGEKLNELPFPARHLVDVDSYHYSIDGVPAMSLIAQLGCPFQCGFCGGRNSPMLRRVRTRTTENVVAEIEHLHKTYGVRGFMLYDDELNVNPQMIPLMEAITDVQDKLGVQFHLRGFIKAQLFSNAQAEAMYRAGFRWILTGFESGSPRILENINKRSTREENTRCVEIARRYGLKVKALMSLGHPGESLTTMEDTQKWLMTTKPDDFDVTIITPYPGSPYYDDAVFDGKAWVYTAPSGDMLFQEEVNYLETMDSYKGLPGEYVSHVWTKSLSRENLVQQRDELENAMRKCLKIPFNPGFPGIRFEHSMGQGLPGNILRTSHEIPQGLATA